MAGLNRRFAFVPDSVSVGPTGYAPATGLDTAAIGLGGSNPFALVVEDGDKHVGCFDITNGIVGNQINPSKRVRRGLRR